MAHLSKAAYHATECPAEIVVEPLQYGEGCIWAVCQPDAHWGEWYSGKESTKERAWQVAAQYLEQVHRKQGY